MQTLLLTIQRLLVANKQLIINIFLAAELAVVAVWAGGAIWVLQSVDNLLVMSEVGRKFATLAAILYLATLVPGIMQRLQIFPILAASFTLFRRHVGILMFLCAYVHQSFLAFFPFILLGEPYFSGYLKIAGFAAMLCLFPLWLTSNDLSQRYLGKWWKILHKLTYLALFFIFIHFMFVSYKFAVLAGIMMVLEVVSWGKVWLKPKIINEPAPQLS